MVLVLYGIDTAPGCRAVSMVAKAIGLMLNIKKVNLFEGEHLEPKFLQINPQHTLPTLDDDGFVIWDSHAISTYLISKYAKDDSLYPKDIKVRAIVDQRLHFDSSVLFNILKRISKPIRSKEIKIVPENLKIEVREAYEFLDAFLEQNTWTCGDSATIADIHLVATISTLQFFVPLTDDCSNIDTWFNNCIKEPWYQANIKGLYDYFNIYTRIING